MVLLKLVLLVCIAAIGYDYWYADHAKKNQPKQVFAEPGWERLSDTFR